MKIITFLLFVILLQLCPPIFGDELICKRARSHLTILDPKAALEEVNRTLQSQQSANHLPLLRTKIQCLAALQEEGAMLLAWKEYRALCPEADHDTELLEYMSWATLQKGAQNPSPLIRMEGALGAFYSQDAKGIPLVKKLLDDPNIQLRLFGLFLASNLRDEVIQTKALELLLYDPSPFVKSAAIETLGNMRAEIALAPLKKLLARENISREEKLSIVQACTHIYLRPAKDDLVALVKSPHSTLRALACSLILQHDMQESSNLVIELVHDTSMDVQMFALQTLAALKPEELFKNEELRAHIHSLCEQTSPQVSISASYLLLVCDEEAALPLATLNKWLNHKNPAYKLSAAAALAHTGTKGIALSEKWLDLSDDLFVKTNLAIHLIKQRINEAKAATVLEECITKIKERIDWQQEGIFTYIAQAVETHIAPVPRYPEAKDLACRLDLYGILATCNLPNLQEALSQFLKERSWGIAGMTAGLLIQEKDDTAIDVIKNLLTEESLEIRLQAAFILAITTQDERALQILQDAFPKAKRELKEQILLGIGAIGSRSSIPFLAIALDEPSPVLRIRAASAILQCLYH